MEPPLGMTSAAPGNRGERIDANVHGHLEAVAACQHKRIPQVVDGGEGDRVQDEIERAVGFLGLVEDAFDVLVFLDVARGNQLGARGLGKFTHTPFHLLARQMREADIRAFL